MDKPTRARNANPHLREDVLNGLQHLRTEAREISRIHAANLQRDMVQLIEFINGPSQATARNRRQFQSTYARMKEALDRLHVRPEKGRRKDLRRIEEAVRSMMKLAFSKNADV